MSNNTSNRGHGKRPTKKEYEALNHRVERLFIDEGMSQVQIAHELNMHPITVSRHISRINERTGGLVTDDDRKNFIDSALKEYTDLLKEGWNTYNQAKLIPEPDKRNAGMSKALAVIINAQSKYESFADKFLKYAGEQSAGPVLDKITINYIMSTPEFDEFVGMFIMFLEEKGHDPNEFHTFCEDLKNGKEVTKRKPKGRERELERRNYQPDPEHYEEAKEMLDADYEDLEPITDPEEVDQ